MPDLIHHAAAGVQRQYIWLLTRGNEAAVVDPGDAEPVIRALEERQLRLTAILATHHHADHVGGLVALKQRYSAIAYGPARESLRSSIIGLRLATRSRCSVRNSRSSTFRAIPPAISRFHDGIKAACTVLRRHAVRLWMRPIVRRHARTNAGVTRHARRIAGSDTCLLRPRIHGGQHPLRTGSRTQQSRIANARCDGHGDAQAR